MELRATSYLKLHEAPLVLVLAQVVISPVLKMQDFIREIQEELRTHGFPRFLEGQVQEVLFRPNIAPVVSSSTKWTFLSKDGRDAVVVTERSIVLEASKYDDFESFAKQLQSIIEAIDKVVRIVLSERLGLRYVNLIRINDGETFNQYLHQGLLGLSHQLLDVNTMLHRCESVASTAVGNLTIRLQQENSGTFLPPDLDAFELAFDIDLRAGETVCILDIDHYSIKPRDFLASTIVEEMWQLHWHVEKAFKASVTPEALKAWKATEVPHLSGQSQ